MHHPNVADALDKLREAHALLPERNRLQHQANRSRINGHHSMADLTEASAEQCFATAHALLSEAIDLLTRARTEAELYTVVDDLGA